MFWPKNRHYSNSTEDGEEFLRSAYHLSQSRASTFAEVTCLEVMDMMLCALYNVRTNDWGWLWWWRCNFVNSCLCKIRGWQTLHEFRFRMFDCLTICMSKVRNHARIFTGSVLSICIQSKWVLSDSLHYDYLLDSKVCKHLHFWISWPFPFEGSFALLDSLTVCTESKEVAFQVKQLWAIAPPPAVFVFVS